MHTPEPASAAGDDPSAAYQAAYYQQHPEVLQGFAGLAKYRPAVIDGYLTLRRAAFNVGPDAALSPKMKELVIIGMECAMMKTNPPPTGHARRAVEAGASIEEIAEVVALCIPIAGMMSYQEAGRFVIEAAEQRIAELKAS
jgi:alkylhydroperoxidase/carboxymuconolactone decarboxylase family protein YurZ